MSAINGILIVDDEADFAKGLARLTTGLFPDQTVHVAGSAKQALEILSEHDVAVCITDMRMPGMGGLDLLAKAKGLAPHLSVVVLTAYGSIDTAVQAMKAGASDFLTKPVELEQLSLVITKGLERARLIGENRRLRELLSLQAGRGVLIGESPAMLKLRQTVSAAAGTDYTVLIRGESGTGKELVARTIHTMSRRAREPFVDLNCPAIPEQFLESELFGHLKGAFTGADKERRGLFVAAGGGTLLLDEIGDISPSVQTKLLRCLQERTIRPLGSNKNIPVDVRILASTNQNLEARIVDKSFREDLYYRLNVMTIRTPPLRDRREDIPLLSRHFLNQACEEMGSAPKDIVPEALAWLSTRSWPGNVRELQNFIRRATVYNAGDTLTVECMRAAEDAIVDDRAESTLCGNQSLQGISPYKDAKDAILGDFTRTYVREVLATTGGNVSETARISGLSRTALQKIFSRMDIDPDEFR
ncbi:two component transcriptional regulator, Fis family [Desulfocurvibacter africanus PCS]|uniref:Two component transcriptional regulator, Fis family n=1 Tax=Desulfocurvibacter africanus PCS TaxID=1262666 RepID=M5Q1C0_DESAF|nr:sigma-54 dependent transcriptional regulator [Desulfocurvibacter africanus]EMG36423.1 two component transcriptional regulator, Fis family [Desulfocurvibacter africanus PCS]